MTAPPAVTVSRDDVLAVCLAVVDEKARPISADTAASVAGLTPAAERVLLTSVRNVLMRVAGRLSEA
jgi:hypothetical protein